jgi:hypothetical protein
MVFARCVSAVGTEESLVARSYLGLGRDSPASGGPVTKKINSPIARKGGRFPEGARSPRGSRRAAPPEDERLFDSSEAVNLSRLSG